MAQELKMSGVLATPVGTEESEKGQACSQLYDVSPSTFASKGV